MDQDRPTYWQEIDKDRPYIEVTLVKKDAKWLAYVPEPVRKELARFDVPSWKLFAHYVLGMIVALLNVWFWAWLTY